MLASCMPYLVCGNSAAAAAASSDDDSAAAAAAAASGDSAAAAAATAVDNEPECPPVQCICPLNYAPVCGSDGITYSNECFMRCVSDESRQRGRSAIFVLHSGPCERYVCNCNYEYKPVCDTNNHTYTNECWLACTNQRRINYRLKPIGLAYRAACLSSSCICPNSIIPVCGTDGKTYRNICILQCYSRLNVAQRRPPIYVATRGACRIENCKCPTKKDEICASDNNTYYNQCFLDCRNRRLGQLGQKLLKIKRKGPCTPCNCPKIRDPVCANNDVTFENRCLFDCENSRRMKASQQKLLMRWRGNCNCNCDNKWNPVCGSDRRTYANMCWLNCENSKRRQDCRELLTVCGRGECRPCRCDYCPQVVQPVCDNLGATHRNVCYFNCNNDCRKAVGLKQLYICKFSRC